MTGGTGDGQSCTGVGRTQTTQVRWLSGEATYFEPELTVREAISILAAKPGLPGWVQIHLVVGDRKAEGEERLGDLEGSITAVVTFPPVALSCAASKAPAEAGDRLKFWDLSSGTCLGSLPWDHASVTKLVADFSRCRAFSGDADGQLRLWDLATFEELAAFPKAKQGTVLAIAADFDNGLAVSASGLDIQLWDLQMPEAAPRRLAAHLAEVHALCIGQRQGPVRSVTLAHSTAVLCAAADFERCQAVSGCKDGSMWVWNFSEQRCLFKIPDAHVWPIYSLAANFETGVVLSTSGQGIMKVWNMDRMECLHKLAGHRGKVTAACSFPYGLAVSGGEEGSLQVYNIETFEPIKTINHAHAGAVLAIAV